MGFFDRLKTGLKKTSDKISDGVTGIFSKKKLDSETLLELEELLISSDMGVETSQKIVKELSKKKFDQEVNEQKIKEALAEIIESIISPNVGEVIFDLDKAQQPYVMMVCGVNGNGKTTTIGKIAKKYSDKYGSKVTFGSCDTFRAAAVDQLRVWADRSKAEIVEGDVNADPASVAYKSLAVAKSNGSDLLIIDTAGRLGNKSHLMDELLKIDRVIKKIDTNAPHDTILILDATSGQNAISQVQSFKNVVNITGIIITKLDGSAKAGVLVAIAQKFNIPIMAVGVGESIEDLDSFDAKQFSRNLVGIDNLI